MNRSWNNNSNPSPGFVYFQQENSYQQSNDSSDYLSFGNSPKHCSPNHRNNFSPSHYSSPRFKQNYNRYNMKHSYRYPEYNRNRSYNSSNESFGSYDSFGSNDSFRGRNRHRRKLDNSHQNSSRGGKRDMSAYLDSTCTKDPWEELEKIEKEQKLVEEENTAEVNENNSINDSSSDDDTESVSEEKSSSSTAEEETT